MPGFVQAGERLKRQTLKDTRGSDKAFEGQGAWTCVISVGDYRQLKIKASLEWVQRS